MDFIKIRYAYGRKVCEHILLGTRRRFFLWLVPAGMQEQQRSTTNNYILGNSIQFCGNALGKAASCMYMAACKVKNSLVYDIWHKRT